MGMSNSEVSVCYGSIGEIFTVLAEGQRRHSYAIVPEMYYDGWLHFPDFKKLEKETRICEDGIKRKVYTAHFNDSGTDWTVTTVKCPHPDGIFKDGRFIVGITKDGQDFSRSNITIGEMFDFIKSRN